MMLTFGIVIYWLGAIADAVTTKRGLKKGATEANPVARELIELVGRADIAVWALKIGVFCLFYLILEVPWWVYFITGLLQGLAAASNHFGWLKKSHLEKLKFWK